MSWNYRVVEKEYLLPRELRVYENETQTYYQIHEVYYDANGNITMYSKEAITPFGEDSVDSLQLDLHKMQEAFNKPILLEKDLINLFKKETK
jgi:hypothetical protein